MVRRFYGSKVKGPLIASHNTAEVKKKMAAPATLPRSSSYTDALTAVDAPPTTLPAEPGARPAADDAATAEAAEAAMAATAPPPPPPMVSYRALFRFADKLDVLLVVVGSLGGLTHGVMMPVFSIIFGSLLDDFNAADTASLTRNVSKTAAYLVYVAIAVFVASYFQVMCFVVAAQRQSARIRVAYFSALLRQEMGWYDEQETGALTARIGDDVAKIQEAIGDKVGNYLQFMSMFVAGMIVAFVYGWRLALVILSVLPLLAAVGYVFSKFFAASASAGQAHYAGAGGVAYEVISLIRTIVAFGTQDREIARCGPLARAGRPYRRRLLAGNAG
jgi:ABC-type multidrug transport system fused ATPase/permease subunit